MMCINLKTDTPSRVSSPTVQPSGKPVWNVHAATAAWQLDRLHLTTQCRTVPWRTFSSMTAQRHGSWQSFALRLAAFSSRCPSNWIGTHSTASYNSPLSDLLLGAPLGFGCSELRRHRELGYSRSLKDTRLTTGLDLRTAQTMSMIHCHHWLKCKQRELHAVVVFCFAINGNVAVKYELNGPAWADNVTKSCHVTWAQWR